MFFAPFVYAEEYKVLVIPDNIVTENEAVDAYIYNAASEFFANEVINILNQTDYITSPTVSEELSSNYEKPPHPCAKPHGKIQPQPDES